MHVLIPAILANANGIIACHNHPSMNVSPSKDDDALTEKIKKACEIIGIKLLDHLIISPEAYYSYADEDRL
ncbi:MAG: hypothetical protein LBJ17_04305 [Dysgonamonadaceae bacterium]|jgi:DNA repair protein RadC|nr:hypothetical protein [Dysgonamonadaceae bacterium]